MKLERYSVWIEDIPDEDGDLVKFKDVEKLIAEIAALRAENERLRNELYKSNLAIINDVIPPCEGDDPLDIGIIIWHKWPGERPVNNDPIERIALSDEGKIYLTKTPPNQWCKGNSFHWAEIPRPEEDPA